MTAEMSVIDGGIKKSYGNKKYARKADEIGGKLTKIMLKSKLHCDILKNNYAIVVQNVEGESPMDDSKLRALLTAVQCGSFGKAAAQLGYTQSAMTHLVSKLEAELGCTLLLRSSKGVRLSEEGERLLPYIHGVITACDALRQEAEAQGEAHSHALRIGCFASIARARLPELLRKFRKQHPEIKVDVLVQGSELAAALDEDRIQLAIVDENCARGFQWTPLTDAPLVAVTPPDFPWTGETISLARLMQEPFLSCPEQYVEQYLPADTPRLEVAASDDGAILSMVAGGLGVSVLSAYSLAGYENQVRVIPLDQPLSRRLGVAVKAMPAANSPARLFLSFLKRQYQNAH